MSIANFRFIVEKNSVQRSISPIGTSEVSIQYTREKDQIFFRRKFKGELILKDSDYTYFKTDYDNGEYCNVYTLYMEKKCEGVWAVDWIGTFSHPDLKFDFDRCTVKIKDPEVLDKYSCFLDTRFKEEINICDFTTANITGATSSYFLFAASDVGYDSEGEVPATMNFNPYGGGAVSYDRIASKNVFGLLAIEWYGVYAREFKKVPTGTSITGGFGWSLNTSNLDGFDIYSRDFSDYNTLPTASEIYIQFFSDPYLNIPNDPGMWKVLTFPAYLCFFPYPCTEYPIGVYIAYSYYTGSKIDINNELTYPCASLANIMNSLWKGCDQLIFNSEFFSNAINPVTEVASKTNNIHIIQKSDAKRPDATEKATNGKIKIEDFFKYLLYIFQVYWYIDDSDNLVFEHISQFSSSLGIDLTTYQQALHQNELEFIKELIYKKEEWEWMEAKGLDFIGKSIIYECVSKETLERSLPDITTDLSYIQNYPEDIADDGFVIIATDGTDIINETGLLSGQTIVNGHLSLANLHYNYWRHNRPLLSGNMNGVDTTFLSMVHLQKLKEISISLCCTEFDPDDKLTHSLGEVYVDSAELSLYDEKLKLNLVK